MIKHDVNKNIYVSRLIKDVDERNTKKVFENFFKCLEQWEVVWNDNLQQSKGVRIIWKNQTKKIVKVRYCYERYFGGVQGDLKVVCGRDECSTN